MWGDESTPLFKALSYRDKLRVRKFLRRGRAPQDPRLAAAAVELAEGYQRQSRGRAALFGWLAVFLAVSNMGLAIWAAIDGDQPQWMFNAAIALGWAGIALAEPALRPKSIGRALEASRRATGSSVPAG